MNALYKTKQTDKKSNASLPLHYNRVSAGTSHELYGMNSLI